MSSRHLALALLLPACAAQAEPAGEALSACRRLAPAAERLACYDALAQRQAAPRFSGTRSVVTEPFVLLGPHRLRFSSEGAIFVLYLMDAAGNVIQNLHLGGGGEGSYRIEQPGTYHLRVNGAEGWRIWLDPE